MKTCFGVWIKAILLAVVLAGCDQAKLDDSQVLVRVNQDEISVHQLNFAVARSPMQAMSPADRDALLERLIDRQLAVQQALEKKLDRRPEVMLRLEEARRDVLAAAYEDELNAGNLPPTAQEAADFYARHPGMFAERKIYRVREIAIPGASPALDEAVVRLDRKDPLEDVLTWLRTQPGSFTDRLAIRPADKLPLEVVDKLHRVKPGETISFRLSRALVIYQVQSTESAPLDWKAAEPLIRAHLIREQKNHHYRQEMERLRAAATITRQTPPPAQ